MAEGIERLVLVAKLSESVIAEFSSWKWTVTKNSEKYPQKDYDGEHYTDLEEVIDTFSNRGWIETFRYILEERVIREKISNKEEIITHSPLRVELTFWKREEITIFR